MEVDKALELVRACLETPPGTWARKSRDELYQQLSYHDISALQSRLSDLIDDLRFEVMDRREHEEFS